MRTIEWNANHNSVILIDQRSLPGRIAYLECHTAEELVDAIREMAIRGAPALGVAGAFGVALKAIEIQKKRDWLERLVKFSELLVNARPTAVNLGWGVKRVMEIAKNHSNDPDYAASLVLQEALLMAEEDVRINQRLAKNGAALINDGDVIIHHCNTGALAGVDWGTALGAIRFAHESGKRVKVLIDETRPRLQGSRLTAWECEQYGIPYEIITDNAAGFFLQRGEVNAVFFGADRVAANGDVVNKVGTYMLSLAANASRVPVYCVFPVSTVDLDMKNGQEIVIEERDPAEVLGLSFEGEQVSPEAAKARNPAFDLTPHDLITAWVTENGVVYPPFRNNFEHSVYNVKQEGEECL
jgi:methylthioribose-1-phosphate isomerase